jgi:hypothetical protein
LGVEADVEIDVRMTSEPLPRRGKGLALPAGIPILVRGGFGILLTFVRDTLLREHVVFKGVAEELESARQVDGYLASEQLAELVHTLGRIFR